MTRIFFLMLLIASFGILSCNSDRSGKANDSDTTGNDTPFVASPEGLGADTSRAASDSLRDSLNR
jgi:hypothetical protein